jgi:hypothetical protein
MNIAWVKNYEKISKFFPFGTRRGPEAEVILINTMIFQ